VPTLDMFSNSTDFESYQPGQVIFREGDPGHVAYVVQSGEIEVQVRGRDIYRVEPGGLFGEMALVDSHPRSATAVARVESRVVAIDEKRFLFLVQQTPFFALTVIRIMAERLRASNQRV